MDNITNLEIYDRVKLKGSAIFGQYLGNDGDGKIYFADEETHDVKKYDASRIEKAYEKY